MMLGITIGGLVIQTLLIWYLWVRGSAARDDLLLEKMQNKALQKTNEILRLQRDNNVTTVDDADRMWAAENETRKLRLSPDTDPDTK